MAQQFICSACGNIDNPKTAVKGNTLIEIILWLCFIIPGLIYSIWRSSSRHKVCTVCRATTLIPINTPIGIKLLADQGKTLDEVQKEFKNRKMSLGRKIFIGIVIVLALFAIIGIANIGNA